MRQKRDATLIVIGVAIALLVFVATHNPYEKDYHSPLKAMSHYLRDPYPSTNQERELSTYIQFRDFI